MENRSPGHRLRPFDRKRNGHLYAAGAGDETWKIMATTTMPSPA
jgi:hypothetical protein